MVGPVVTIGVPGTSHYKVDWKPQYQGLADFGRGLGELGKGIKAARDEKSDEETVAKIMSMSGPRAVATMGARNMELPEDRQRQALALAGQIKDPQRRNFAMTAISMMKRPTRKTARDKNDRLRYLDDGGYAFDDVMDTPSERRIVKGADNFNYYADDRSRVLPGVTAPPPKQDRPKITDSMRLADEWQEATKPVRDLMRQRDLMGIGLEAAAKGNMVAGSQAVLVTFQKILDPTSVVRESEYARSSSGLALIERVKGEFEKLKKGGAGLTLEQLRPFAQLADEAVAKLSNGRVREERERIGRFADHYGIDKSIIFSGNLGTGAPPEPPAQPAPTRQGNASDRFADVPWQGPAQSAPAQASMMASPAVRPAPAAVRKDQFGGSSQPAPRQYTSPDPGHARMGSAGLNDLNAPPAPDAQPGDLEQAVEYLSSLPEAEMSGLNLQSMTLTGLKALKIARQRRNDQTMANDYMQHIPKNMFR